MNPSASAEDLDLTGWSRQMEESAIALLGVPTFDCLASLSVRQNLIRDVGGSKIPSKFTIHGSLRYDCSPIRVYIDFGNSAVSEGEIEATLTKTLQYLPEAIHYQQGLRSNVQIKATTVAILMMDNGDVADTLFKDQVAHAVDERTRVTITPQGVICHARISENLKWETATQSMRMPSKTIYFESRRIYRDGQFYEFSHDDPRHDTIIVETPIPEAIRSRAIGRPAQEIVELPSFDLTGATIGKIHDRSGGAGCSISFKSPILNINDAFALSRAIASKGR